METGVKKHSMEEKKKILSRKRNSLRALLSLVPVRKFVSRMTKEGFNFGEIELDLPPIFCVRGECKKGSPQFPRRKAEDGKLSPSPFLLRKKWWLRVDALADSCDSLVFSLAKIARPSFPPHMYTYSARSYYYSHIFWLKGKNDRPPCSPNQIRKLLFCGCGKTRKLGSVDIGV